MPPPKRLATGQSPLAERKKDTPADAHPTARRLAPEEREQQIVDKAIEHFATHGFSGSTRELAKQIGITQPLLYRYFPSKEALIDRVYSEVYRWDPAWERLIADRSVPLRERLCALYTAYSHVILQREWIRTFIFAGLTREGINRRYLDKLRERIFRPVMAEIRDAYDLPIPATAAAKEAELELIWSLHASIFYVGVRKWVYGLPVPKDLDAHVALQVDAFLNGSPAALKSLLAPAARNSAAKSRAS
ncbi:TetR/AcrR family transcriptional regulator [Paraburkholderia silviterrae]|uniref:TetR/AcrR family transcriptional regulator n=1 Tax=Paraburkholderia silviterrae TaxID=2528715 RepID=A0A4R5M9B5_9BURK|nr:TetR/AcrR family transcriptional regulator [Paraburkholderia silviterrae]TDG23115.1 TetR/AcrR family transcriptional regulator [Paraburkholderia silviterrae]